MKANLETGSLKLCTKLVKHRELGSEPKESGF